MKGKVIIVGALNYSTTEVLKINYCTALASGDNIDVLLTQTDGTPFWGARSTLAGKRWFHGNLNGHEVNGIKCPTFVNCSYVIVGVEKVIT